MDISDYIKNYDFSNYIQIAKENFKQQKNIQKYLEKNSEGNFLKFSEEFWENSNLSIDLLKEKYNIKRQISYSNIIKAYPTNEYIRFLNLYYSNTTIDNLVKEFAMPYSRLEKLIIPIVINDCERYCTNCFNNSFEINIGIDSANSEKIICKCQNCNNALIYSELLTKENVEEKIERITKEKLEFDEKILKYESILEEIKCPRCQEKLYINKLSNLYEYNIKCEKCNYSSDNIDETVRDFQAWKQRAAMMIAIKAKEQELIEKALQNKKEKDILFTKEDIITSNENNETLRFWQVRSKMDDDIKLSSEIFKRIKSCNRLEKKLLSQIIELAKDEGEKRIIPFVDENVSIYAYMPKEPIIYSIIEKTKIIVARQIIRKLMERNFILASEEANYILVPEILIINLDIIENLIVVKDMNPNIRYLVFQRQNFTCMTCGETGRPLKIAYLTSNKNINDLSSIVALCDNCYELSTRNEILIDGSITFEVDFFDKKRLKSLEFLIQYHPELKNNESIIKTLENWENSFDIQNVIRALTITIDRIKRNKMEGTVSALLSYTNGILKNNADTGNSVYIYDNLKEQYNLQKWTEDLLD